LGNPCAAKENDTLSFCADPDHYSWCHAGKRDMHVPFKYRQVPDEENGRLPPRALFDRNIMRWELHPIWVVDGRIRRGESNVLHRRRFYIEQNNWLILFGEGFDPADNMIKCYLLDARANSPMTVFGRWYRV
jgi:hypothetical protein